MTLLPCVACVAALVLLGRLTISIEDRVLKLRFGLLPVIGKEIPLALVSSAEPVRYRPIREFGGWGIRRGSFRDTPTAVYSLRGSSGVLLTLEVPIDTLFARTDRVLIGSRAPEQLAQSLTQLIGARAI